MRSFAIRRCRVASLAFAVSLTASDGPHTTGDPIGGRSSGGDSAGPGHGGSSGSSGSGP